MSISNVQLRWRRPRLYGLSATLSTLEKASSVDRGSDGSPATLSEET